MSVPASGSASKTRFTDAQTKFIAEFYVRNFEILRRDQDVTPGLNRERTRLYNQVTQDLNARWAKQYTVDQVHHKLKNMKAEARDLVIEVDNGLRSLNGEDPDVPQMSEAESIIVSKIISHRNSQSSNHGPSPNMDGLIRVPSPDDEAEEDGQPTEDFLAAQAVQDEYDRVPVMHQSPHSIPPPPLLQPTIQPGGLRTLTPVRNGTHRATISNAQKRKLPLSTNDGSVKALKRSVLQLQRRVLEGQLQMQQEKRVTLAKFTAAIDEFRRHVAEQRMQTRGVDVTNVPIDIPPGMQGIGIE